MDIAYHIVLAGNNFVAGKPFEVEKQGLLVDKRAVERNHQAESSPEVAVERFAENQVVVEKPEQTPVAEALIESAAAKLAVAVVAAPLGAAANSPTVAADCNRVGFVADTEYPLVANLVVATFEVKVTFVDRKGEQSHNRLVYHNHEVFRVHDHDLKLQRAAFWSGFGICAVFV